MYEIKLKSLHQKIRVGAVSYLNAKPLTYGLERGGISGQIELIYAAPAVLADLLKKGEIDLGLVPVAALNFIPGSHVVGNHCIGSEGKVESVALFSDCPLDEITDIYIDFESRTSASLIRILLEELWKIEPRLIQAEPGYENLISGSVAGLIIGDRALKFTGKTINKFDLSAAWKELTGLPFVFATWITTQDLPEEFIQGFDKANGLGFGYLEEIIKTADFREYDLMQYYTRDIRYRLDETKMKAIALFLDKLKQLNNHRPFN